MGHARTSQRRPLFRSFYILIGCLAITGILWVLVQNSHDEIVLPTSVGEGAASTQNDATPGEISSLDPSLAATPDGARRLIYPYSVIKGGVRDVRELKEAISKDPVVAKHFAGFKLEQTRIVPSQAGKLAHVAYRVHNDVFWTRRKLNLVAGEKLVTDGRNYARARCGNRIIEDPPEKTSPLEPDPKTLDTPQADPQHTTSSPTPETIALLGAPVPNPSSPPKPDSSDGGVFVPPIPIIPVGGSPADPPGGGTTPPTGGGTTPPNGGLPVTPVPEPGTLLLVSSGVASYLAYRKKFQK